MRANRRGVMSADEPQTIELLDRWRAGDNEALSDLLARDMDWIRRFVHNKLGRDLRKFGDTGDFVQEAVVRVLTFGPRFVMSSREQFRGLMAKIVLNLMRGKHRELFALKRRVDKEKPLGSDSLLYLDRPQSTVIRPEQAAEHAEEKEWLRLGLLLLEPKDQTLIDLHWQGLTDAQLGERVGVSANTARMRRNRAVGRLTKLILDLQSGRLDEVLAS